MVTYQYRFGAEPKAHLNTAERKFSHAYRRHPGTHDSGFLLRRRHDFVRARTTSPLAQVTDVMRAGKLALGYGFASAGRYGQRGPICERQYQCELAVYKKAVVSIYVTGTDTVPFPQSNWICRFGRVRTLSVRGSKGFKLTNIRIRSIPDKFK